MLLLTRETYNNLFNFYHYKSTNMARRKISPQFRARLSEKLMDLGNLVAAGLVIGQFISGKEFSSTLFLV